MSKPLILMYHRIADEPVDYWGLAVTPAHFEEQLSVLRRTWSPLPLAEFVGNLTAGTLAPDAVAVTFDDGYADNFVAGLPRLAAADVPATVFLATGYLDRHEPFWWDELARLVLLGNVPKRFEIVIHGELRTFEVSARSAVADDDPETSLSSPARGAALEAIYKPLRNLEDSERCVVMSELRTIFEAPADRDGEDRPMTSNEVRALVKDGLVAIGSHTVTHPSLPQLGAAARDRELTESRMACEALFGAPITAFAYPYGEFDAEAREAVRRAGFRYACSARRAPAIAACDLFTLPRVYAPNVGADAFEHHLRRISDRQ